MRWPFGLGGFVDDWRYLLLRAADQLFMRHFCALTCIELPALLAPAVAGAHFTRADVSGSCEHQMGGWHRFPGFWLSIIFIEETRPATVACTAQNLSGVSEDRRGFLDFRTGACREAQYALKYLQKALAGFFAVLPACSCF